MNVGDFVKWSFVDEEGPGHHIGKIISLNDKRIVFRTNKGTMDVSLKDGTFEQTKAVKIDDVPVVIIKPVKKRNTSGGTAYDKVVILYKSKDDWTRKELIAAIVDQIGMTSAGASTYAWKVMKK